MATKKAASNGATASEGATVIELAAPDLRMIQLTVVGTSPLICHKWSEKAKKEMLDKHMKKATKAKEAKDPEQDYEGSLYPHPDGGYGFPAVAFKAAAVRAGTYADMTMTFLRGAFYIPGELVKIEGDPEPREDMVKVGMGKPDIRYRGMFPTWRVTLPLRYNARIISAEQIVNLFQVAGFSVGVGEWRPERNGSFGTFEVAGN